MLVSKFSNFLQSVLCSSFNVLNQVPLSFLFFSLDKQNTKLKNKYQILEFWWKG